MPQKPGIQGKRFKKLIRDKLHWPAGGIGIAQAASILWKECRNPLTHATGLDEKAHHKYSGLDEPVAGMWGDVKPERMRNVDQRKTWPDNWPILSLDRAVLREATGKPARLKLTIVALYWSVKRLVQEFAK